MISFHSMVTPRKPFAILVVVFLLSVSTLSEVVRGRKEDDDDNDGDKEEMKVMSAPERGVTYDGRSLIINGKRELLYSGSVHYPRMPAEMWDDVLRKAKKGGLNTIQTYVFWNAHEPEKGKFCFEGNRDLVKFIKKIGEHGMFATLRIGPFIQAEWSHGGLPYWLKDEKGIIFRTQNEAWQREMQRWILKVIDLMKENELFASQGGPIILGQIENEYDHVMAAFDHHGVSYIKWAGELVLKQNLGIPWMMCEQKDGVPGDIIDACNGRHCGDNFEGPNAPNKPKLWPENWVAQYRVFGDPPSQRPAEDIANSVARWFARNGTHVNYYMYYGGTNYGRTGASFVLTRYYDEAPLDEFGKHVCRDPKYGHLRDFHFALQLSKKALLWGSVYQVQEYPNGDARWYEKPGTNVCAAFLSNNNTHLNETVQFKGRNYILPPKSVSILPDCKTVVFNTKMVVAQHSARSFVDADKANRDLKWEYISEPVPDKGPTVRSQTIDQYTLARDTTDYVWYITSIELDELDLPFTRTIQPVMQLLSLGHSLLAFVNGRYVGTQHGIKKAYQFHYDVPIRLHEGVNTIAILSSTVGMPDSGAYQEHRYAGIKSMMIQGLATGNLDLDFNSWQHKVGMEGETNQYFTVKGAKKANWTPLQKGARLPPLTWYKTYFDAPEGDDPVAINMINMTKGMIWVNGQSLGRHWSANLSPLKAPSQNEYHIPRSFLKEKDNLLVIFDEYMGEIEAVKIQTVNRDIICSWIGENYPPHVRSWKRDSSEILTTKEELKTTAELQCPENKVINAIEFASFGDPWGCCGLFKHQTCSVPGAEKVVEKFCLGKHKCTVPLDRNLFMKGNKDPCPHLDMKTLAIQARCGLKQ